MPIYRLHLVMSQARPEQPCTCRTWGLLSGLSRDLILADLMDWARTLHQVQLTLLARGDRVALCELLAARPGEGRARRVMTEICSWANCARVTLELTPSGHWGDVQRLTQFYVSLGFEPDREPEQAFLVPGAMIRYPVQGRGHVRL